MAEKKNVVCLTAFTPLSFLQTQRDLNQETKLLQKRLEKELIKKHELEDRIDVLLRDKLSATKTSAYVKKMATNVHDQSRELEAQVCFSIYVMRQYMLPHFYKFVSKTSSYDGYRTRTPTEESKIS